jgi:hypothetical protein
VARCIEKGCKRPACHGSIRCASHDPAKAEARKALAAKMVAARRLKKEQSVEQPQPIANLPPNPNLQARCKRHNWTGGWWEDCPRCTGKAPKSNPDAVQTADWVNTVRNQ